MRLSAQDEVLINPIRWKLAQSKGSGAKLVPRRVGVAERIGDHVNRLGLSSAWQGSTVLNVAHLAKSAAFAGEGNRDSRRTRQDQ